MIKIRRVDASHPLAAAQLQLLQLLTLPGDQPCDTREGYWWIAFDDDTPVAFAGMTRSERWSDTGYLCRSGVLPRYRGQGLQRRLVRVREATAKRIGWNWLITDTFQNPPSANSLIGCGFKTYAPLRPWGFDGAIYWRKRLKGSSHGCSNKSARSRTENIRD